MVAAVFEFGGIGVLGVFSLRCLQTCGLKTCACAGCASYECDKGLSGGVLENHWFAHSQCVGIVGIGLGDVSGQGRFYRFI